MGTDVERKYSISIVDADNILHPKKEIQVLCVNRPHRVQIHEVTGQIIITGVGGEILASYPNTVVFESIPKSE